MSFYYLASPCPPSYHLPFDALITVTWIMLAIICGDLIISAGSLVVARSQGGAVVLLALLLGAPIALGLIFSLQRQNLALCLIPGGIHMTPQTVAMLVNAYTQAVRHAAIQARATFLAIALIAFFGTLTALVTLPGERRWLLRLHMPAARART